MFSEEIASRVPYTANYLIQGPAEYAFEETGPDAFGRGIDAAFRYGDDRTYFFRGKRYVRYNGKTDRMDKGYPRNIAGNWHGFSFTNGVDAAFRGKGAKIYFFKGDKYVRYDMKKDRQDPGYPKSIKGPWKGLSFTNGIDAAVDYDFDKHRVYFFKGDKYVRYNMKTDRQDPGYPKSIKGPWKGISFASGISAALGWKNQSSRKNKVYFFKGGQYVRHDTKSDRQEKGYPKNITSAWHRIPGGQTRKGTANLEKFMEDVDRELKVTGIFTGQFNSTNSSFRVASQSLTKAYCDKRRAEMGFSIKSAAPQRSMSKSVSKSSKSGSKNTVVVRKISKKALLKEKILPVKNAVK